MKDCGWPEGEYGQATPGANRGTPPRRVSVLSGALPPAIVRRSDGSTASCSTARNGGKTPSSASASISIRHSSRSPTGREYIKYHWVERRCPPSAPPQGPTRRASQSRRGRDFRYADAAV